MGDFNRDGRPDVAVVTPTYDGSSISVFLNNAGKFRDEADHVIAVSGVTKPSKLRVCDLNDDEVPDFLVGGQQTALLLSTKRKFPSTTSYLSVWRRVTKLAVWDLAMGSTRFS